MAILKRMTSNIAAQVIAMAVSMADRVILVGILLRYWNAEVFADFAVLQSFASLLLVAELGFQLYFQNAQHAAFSAGDRALFRRLAAIHMGILLLIAGILATALVLAMFCGTFDQVLAQSHLDPASSRAIFFMLAGANLLTILRSGATTIYTARGDFVLVVLLGAMILLVATLLSAAAAVAGAGPVALAAIFLAVNGIAALAGVSFDIQARYRGWTAPPALPSRGEWRSALQQVKWFSLQIIAPSVWLQVPVLVLNGWNAGGVEIASFLLIRTMVNLVRQFFQFAVVGTGLEIAGLVHQGEQAKAWRHSARIGLLTTVLSAVCFAGILCFGQAIVGLWTGNIRLFSVPLAFMLLLPLLLVAPLQQPLALLQFSNRARAPGIQRMLQILLGPVLCIWGEILDGTFGMVSGLALAEVLAGWAIVPFLAQMQMFDRFAAYLARCLVAGAGALGICWLAGLALGFYVPAADIFALLAKLAIWSLGVALPLVVLALPEPVRRAFLGKFRTLASVLPSRFAFWKRP